MNAEDHSRGTAARCDGAGCACLLILAADLDPRGELAVHGVVALLVIAALYRLGSREADPASEDPPDDRPVPVYTAIAYRPPAAPASLALPLAYTAEPLWMLGCGGLLALVYLGGCALAAYHLASFENPLLTALALVWLFPAAHALHQRARASPEPAQLSWPWLRELAYVAAWRRELRAIGPADDRWLAEGGVLAGRFIARRRLRLADVVELTWSAGQGSARVGRDLSDWQVVLWHGDGQVWCLGGPWPRAGAAALGAALAERLIDEGLVFRVRARELPPGWGR